MIRLQLLRDHLLKTCKLKPEQVHTFAETGDFRYNDSSGMLILDYTGIVIITDTPVFSGIAAQVAHWHYHFMPEFADNAGKRSFDAEVIDHDLIDLEFKLQLRDKAKFNPETGQVQYCTPAAWPLKTKLVELAAGIDGEQGYEWQSANWTP